MKFYSKFIFCASLLFCHHEALSQVTMTESEAVTLAIHRNPWVKAAALEVQQQKKLEGTSFNLANPDFVLESPTGEFMTVGVMQSFEFPSVYIKQGQLAKQNTLLAEKEKKITNLEVTQQVKFAYLNFQYLNSLLTELQKKDSLFSEIAKAAERQFNAGQIDFVENTFAASQSGETHLSLMQTIEDLNQALQKLQILTFTEEKISVPPINNRSLAGSDLEIPADSNSLSTLPGVQYYFQLKEIARTSLQLEKTKALPGFSIGYFNQGLAGTPNLLRIRAGINIPIWFWQYSASIKAAKINLEATQEILRGQQQSNLLQLEKIKSDLSKYSISIQYYESKGLQQSRDLAQAAKRMFEAGESDCISYLRTLNDALEIQFNYLESLKNYHISFIQYLSIIGK